MSVEQEVKSHTQRVEAGEPVWYGACCPGCPNSDPQSFRVHDCRARTFRLLIEGYVKVVRSGIWRWTCLKCRRRFTDYPRLPCRTSVL